MQMKEAIENFVCHNILQNQVSFIQGRILTECYFNDSDSCEVVKTPLTVQNIDVIKESGLNPTERL